MTAATIHALQAEASTTTTEQTQATPRKPTRSEWFRLRQPRTQCRHILASGLQCGSPALREELFCYYHHTSRRPIPLAELADRKATQSTFELPPPEDGLAVQVALGEVLRRIATNNIDRRRAGLLLYGLQIASSNLHRLNLHQPRSIANATTSTSLIASTSAHTRCNGQPNPAPRLIDELIADEIHGDLAPETEWPLEQSDADRTPEQVHRERAIRRDERERFEAQLFTLQLKLRAEIQSELREEEARRRHAHRLAQQYAEQNAQLSAEVVTVDTHTHPAPELSGANHREPNPESCCERGLELTHEVSHAGEPTPSQEQDPAQRSEVNPSAMKTLAQNGVPTPLQQDQPQTSGTAHFERPSITQNEPQINPQSGHFRGHDEAQQTEPQSGPESASRLRLCSVRAARP